MQQVLHIWHHLDTTTKLVRSPTASQSTAYQHTRVCRLACSFSFDYAIFITDHEPGNNNQHHDSLGHPLYILVS